MKLLILSDIHGNLDALDAICEPHDELWVLGDIVNYGPQPRETLEAVRATASVVVQGNHDYAVGHCDDSLWSARFREVAEDNAPLYLQSIERFAKGLASKLCQSTHRLSVKARAFI